MTNQEAINLIDNLKGMIEDNHNSDYDMAFNMAIKALENVGHLTDRPCSVCEFHKENGCCKWNCVFEGV